MVKRKTCIKLVILLSLIITTSCKTGRLSYESSDILIQNVNIIPMTSEVVIEDMDLLIADGQIVKIGDLEDLELDEDIIVIDGKGKYLTPGFSDMHVHAYREQELSLYLANGITTVRNMWGMQYHLEGRDKIKTGELLGPEFFTTGPLTDGKNAVWEGSNIITDPDDVQDSLRQMKSDGYDYVKVYNMLSSEVFDKIIEVAEELHMPVVGHVPFSVDLKSAINADMHSIEHFQGYRLKVKKIEDLDEEIKMTTESGIWNCPTLVVLRSSEKLFNKYTKPELFTVNSIPELKYIHPDDLRWWKSANGYDLSFEKSKILLDVLYNRGANIVSGTDNGNPYIVPGFSLHDEFELMNEAGLTPYDVLLTTTINPAKMLGIEDRSGTIEIGKDADLVLLNRNPLENIANTRSIKGVVTKGRWLSGETLQEMLNEVVRTYNK